MFLISSGCNSRLSRNPRQWFCKIGGVGGWVGDKQGALWSMRKWWIEFFLELWKCFSLFAAHTLGACLPLCEVPQQISWNFLKMHLLCMNWRLDFMQTNWLFFDVSGKVLSLIRFANDPYTRLNRINASRFAPFRKTRKHVNRGQTQCWALFVISKATFTKTAIKPHLDDRFSLKNFDAAIDQCTIKCIDLDNFLLWDFLLSRV